MIAQMLRIHVCCIGFALQTVSICIWNFFGLVFDECIRRVVEIVELVSTNYRGIALSKMIFCYCLRSLKATVIALSHELSWLRHSVPLRVIALFLAQNNFLRLPVSLVAPTEAVQVIEAASVEWIAKFAKGFFQVLVRSLVSAQKVLVIAEEEEDKDAQKGCQCHDNN